MSRFSFRLFSALVLPIMALSFQGRAQSDDNFTIQLVSKKIPVKQFYYGNSLDGAIFSTAFINKPGQSRETATVRFSMFLHLGFTYNYDFDKSHGFYTGLDLKNIGFIDKEGGVTAKYRIYALGVPVGVRFGNMQTREYFFGGAGLDFALNFKQKIYEKRNHKDKLNEWFSARTPLLMPYFFAGYSFKGGLSLKVQYYPLNFLNQNFEEKVAGVTVRPYENYDNSNLLLFSVGADFHYKVRTRY